MEKRVDDVTAGERSGRAETEMKRADDGSPAGSDCRCKEAKGKTVPELLKVILRDFAFWKKPRE